MTGPTPAPRDGNHYADAHDVETAAAIVRRANATDRRVLDALSRWRRG